MRVRDDSSEELRAARSTDLASPIDRLIPGGALPAGSEEARLPAAQVGFHLLVQDPLESALGNTEIAGAEASVETSNAFFPQRLHGAVQRVPVLPHGLRPCLFGI